MKNFLEMPDDQKKKIIKEAVHESNWAQVKIVYKKELDKEIQKARIDEVKKTDEKFSSLHQTTEGAGNVSYGEFGEYLDDRLKQLEKGEK